MCCRNPYLIAPSTLNSSLCAASRSSLAQSKSHNWGIASFAKYAALPPPHTEPCRR